MAAAVAPGNTSVNVLYEHEGCVCPKEYYGPHCEFIRHDTSNNQSNKSEQEDEEKIATSTSSTASPTANSGGGTSTTAAKSNKSIQDLIRDYNDVGGGDANVAADETPKSNNSNNTPNNNNNKSNTMMVWLTSLLAFLLVASAVVAFKVVRYRRQQTNGTKQLRRHKKRQGIRNWKSPATVLLQKEPLKNPNQKQHKKSKKHSQHRHHQGTADLSPFAIDNDDGTDQTLSTTQMPSWDSRSHTEQVMAHSNQASGGWVAAVSHHLDAFIGVGRPEQDEYVVDDDDEFDNVNDGVSDIYTVDNGSHHDGSDGGYYSNSSSPHLAFLTGEDDDDDLFAAPSSAAVHPASLWGDSWD